MRIHNVRLGHACNSSSSHSLIFIPKDKQKGLGGDGNEYSDFGWGTFTLTDPKAKAQYLAVQLFQSMRGSVGGQIASHVVKSMFGHQVNLRDDEPDSKYKRDYEPKGSPEGHVDHQSVWSLPLTFDGKATNLDFFEDLSKWIMQDDLVILGGNDNDGDHPEETGRYKDSNFTLPFQDRSHGMRARKDKAGGFWTLYNPDKGNKMRVSFDRQDLESTYKKSTLPELVDLKITDYCPIGCAFCYQNSTKEGVHADMRNLQSIISALGSLEVFEVAIGGGEPTMHPDFLKILHQVRGYHITPNFTTKSLAWLKNAPLAKEILDTTGMFAYSVTSVDEIEKLTQALGMLTAVDTGMHQVQHRNGYFNKMSVQYVLGTTSLEEFQKILEFTEENGIRITILGYKQVGRGPAFEVENHDGWFSVLQNVYKDSWQPVGIDTAVVQQFEADLIAAGIPDEWYHKEEGKFSCYIDAVEMTMAPSSYEGGTVKLYDGKEPDRYASYEPVIERTFATF